MNETTNLTNDELKALQSTKSGYEWNSVCDQVKRARGGQYPPDWYPKVLASGLAGKVMSSWK